MYIHICVYIYIHTIYDIKSEIIGQPTSPRLDSTGRTASHVDPTERPAAVLHVAETCGSTRWSCFLWPSTPRVCIYIL